MDAVIVATVVTGGVGIAALCISRLSVWFNALVVVTSNLVWFGFDDNAIVDTHEVEFKKVNAIGNDVIYVGTTRLILTVLMMRTQPNTHNVVLLIVMEKS